MRSVPILPSSGSSRRSVAMVLRNCSGSSCTQGNSGCDELRAFVGHASDKGLPEIARACLAALGAQLRMLKAQILEFDRMINAWPRSNETNKRLHEIPGVGPALATALVASVADPRAFRSGRDFSAWIGLV